MASRNARTGIDRRTFLAGSAAAAAAGWTLDLWTPARARALARTLSQTASPEGTTLATTVVRSGATGYRTLVDGPGWPVVVRTEMAEPKAGREDRRRPLAAFAHLTDAHIVDAQSPGRVEFIDVLGGPFTGGCRPQDSLSTQVLTSMVMRINALAGGPVTGRALDCAVNTGDNIDNAQINELDWFIRALDGGQVVANSGDPTRYEGTQDLDDGNTDYWHPDAGMVDGHKTIHGFPDIDGLLQAAIAGFSSPGLDMPWYSTHGNHDGLVQGNLGPSADLDEIFTGDRKVTGLPAGTDAGQLIAQLFGDQATFLADLASGRYPQRQVTADADRRLIRRADWVRMHLEAPKGPHGYVPDDLTSKQLWFTFEVAPGVLGVSLDTCTHGGSASGSMTEGQLDWLEATLAGVHSQHLASDGTVVRTGNEDSTVLIFSHHPPGLMGADLEDPDFPGERRVLGPELVTTLHRFPNVIGWVNGHTHAHGIGPHPDPSGRTQGFWEITTASHIDYPEHARIVELVDNADGTLSLFCTIIEHAAPAQSDYGDHSVLGLASISRELSANDPQGRQDGRLGGPEVRNVELVIKAPFLRGGIVPPGSTTSIAPSPNTSTSPGEELARTGPSAATDELVAVGGGLLALGAASLAGVVALRRRAEGRAGDVTAGA